MKFVADDGKIFDTMEECEEYEKMNGEGQEIARLWYDYVTTYNMAGKITEPLSSVKNTKLFLHEVSEIISDSDDSAFIYIAPDCPWEKIRDYLYEEYGYELPDDGDGFWRYDDEKCEWIRFENEFKNFKANWVPVGIHLMRL